MQRLIALTVIGAGALMYVVSAMRFRTGGMIAGAIIVGVGIGLLS